MNTIFKVLWNRTTQTFVVTSELAKSKGKSSTKAKTDKRFSLIKFANIVLLSICPLFSGQALAAEKTQTTMSFCVQGRDTGNDRSCAEVTAPLKDTKYNSEVHVATPGSSVELGKASNTAQKPGAIAIGQSANGSAWGGVAIGWGAQLTETQNSDGKTNADESVAMGYQATVTGRDGTALGGRAKAVEKSVAIGSNAQATAKHALALGRDSLSSHEGAIALGTGARTTAPISTSSANIDGIQYNNFAGSTAHSTLSIGSDSIKRTLTNLAAGRIAPDSTDAINGSQIYSIAKKLQDDKANKSQAYTFTIQNRASSLNNNQGNADRWTLAADDSLSFGVTTALSVTTDGAGKIVYDLSDETKQNITKAKTTVQSGKNTTVTSKTNQNGSTNYIINAESPFEYVTENGDKLVLVDGQLYPEDQLNTDGSLKTNARAYTGKTKIHARNNGNAKQVVSNLASGRILNESDDAVTGNQLFNYVNVNGTAATTNGKVNFVNGTNTIVTNENGNISYKVANTTLGVTNIGALTLGNSAQGNYFVTANDMIQAINNSGWRIKASADGGSSSGGKEHLVKPSGLVELVAGNNIDITQADGKFTISTTAPKNGKDGVTLTSIDKQDGVTTIRFSDGKSFEVRDGAKGDKGDPGVAGAKGERGEKGADGKNGDSVKATVQNDGSVKYEIIDGTDSSVKNGEKGERGEKGETGAKGDKGADGKNGDSVKATVQNDGSVKYEIIDGTDNSVKNTQVVKNGEKGERGEKGDKGNDGTGDSGGTPQDSISEENVIAGNNIHVAEKKDKNRTGKDFIVSLNDQITLGQKEDGSLEIKNTGDNTRIAIRNGTISITTADGKNAVITVDQGAPTVSERDSDKQGIERITYVSKDPSGKPTKRELATMDDGLVFAGDSGENSKNTLGSTLTISGGETDHTKLTNKPNIGVHSNGKGKLSVKLAKNIDLTKEGSLAIGDTTVNNTGITIKNGPSITKSGVNAGGKRITNVAPGVNGTDAVNVDQLNQVNAQVRAGIASAGAMANLPQVHLSGKSSIMAAAANYRGESAYAIGYSRISDNGKLIIRLSGSSNTQKDFMIGGGMGYIW
ncbi:YadA-like family protein [Actinobacillus porcinus]|uniref:YadA-like family protein n=1 Tax=Actinobacillus porcinus TaxID=51048 RepID=UPI0023570A08|nr:YadA-like family protein [Actinobacillus porcinus]